MTRAFSVPAASVSVVSGVPSGRALQRLVLQRPLPTLYVPPCLEHGRARLLIAVCGGDNHCRQAHRSQLCVRKCDRRASHMCTLCAMLVTTTRLDVQADAVMCAVLAGQRAPVPGTGWPSCVCIGAAKPTSGSQPQLPGASCCCTSSRAVRPRYVLRACASRGSYAARLHMWPAAKHPAAHSRLGPHPALPGAQLHSCVHPGMRTRTWMMCPCVYACVCTRQVATPELEAVPAGHAPRTAP